MQIHASSKEIMSGITTDVYFTRAERILKAEKQNPEVTAEVWAKNLPENYRWALFTGLGEALDLFKEKDIDIWSLPEGSIFYKGEPVFTIRGKYLDFARFETPLLGFLCQASGISTKAARCKIAAGERTILSFGARRMHPSITPVIDRYAYMGGVDGVSAIISGEKLKIEAQGTIPHSVILILGDTVKAARAYEKTVEKDIPRIILVDTFLDEKVETLRVAKTLGKKLDAVRIDTPYSRKGDFKTIAWEIREELDINGFNDIEIFASGGIDESDIRELNPWVSGYGVGTSLSNAQTINFSLDIVEIEGIPKTKKGKISGMKSIYECIKCGTRKTVYSNMEKVKCDCGALMNKMSKKIMEKGEITDYNDDVSRIREYVLKEIRYKDV